MDNQPMGIGLHQATEADEAFLKTLFEEIHAAELLPAALPADVAAQLMDMQYRGQKMSYEAQFPAGESYIVGVDGERVGRVFVHEMGDELRLVDIAITPAWQRRGVGTKLMADLQERARKNGLPLHLSVRPASPAARFYGRRDFKEVSRTPLHLEMEWRADYDGCRAERDASVAERVGMDRTAEPRLGTSSDGFRRLEGRDVHASLPDGRGVTLRVGKLRMLTLTQPGMVANDSFTVMFSGPTDAVLTQATYRLRYREGEDELEVFLTPLGPRGDVMEYEALFNRMAPQGR